MVGTGCDTIKERTLVILKPEAARLAHLLGQCVEELGALGLTPKGCMRVDLVRDDPGRAVELYQPLLDEGKSYARHPIMWLLSGSIIVMVMEGPDAVAKVREWIGPTSIGKAMTEEPDSARGRALIKYGIPEPVGMLSKACNYFHSSATPADAKREIGIFYPEG